MEVLVAELEGLALQAQVPWGRLVYFVVEEVEEVDPGAQAAASAVPVAEELYLQEEVAEEERRAFPPFPVPTLHLKLVAPGAQVRVAGELAIQ